MTDLIHILAQDSEGSAFSGVLHGWQGIIGIIMAVTGLLIIYFGIRCTEDINSCPSGSRIFPRRIISCS